MLCRHWCLKIIVVIKLIARWSQDTDPNHKERADWAIYALRLLQGAKGFYRLVRFGMDCDFMTLCSKMVQLADPDSRDISLHVDEMETYTDITQALFCEGRIFQESCVGTDYEIISKVSRCLPLGSWECPMLSHLYI